LLAGNSSDLASDPTNANRLYAAVLGVGIFRTDNLGGAWTPVSTGDAALNAAITAAGNNNLEMSVAANGRIYAGVIRNGRCNYIGFSDNQGGTWTEMDLPISLEGPVNITNASNTNPIVITAPNHGLNDNNPHTVRIAGVTGNTAANGDFQINTATVTAHTFTLLDLNGNPVAATPLRQRRRRLFPQQPRCSRAKTPAPGWHALLHAADPNNANIVYVGGDRQDRPTSPNSLRQRRLRQLCIAARRLPPSPGSVTNTLPHGNT
jgi:hypothetical protein